MKTSKNIIMTPAAWCRLRHHANATENEIGAWGISSKSDPMVIEDLWLPLQQNNPCYVEMDDDSINKYTTEQMIAGNSPENFMRVWIHTHPGSSATPSGHDWDTFKRLSEEFPWVVMLIMAEPGNTTVHYRKDSVTTPAECLVDFNGIFSMENQTIDIGKWDEAIKAVENKGEASPFVEPPKNNATIAGSGFGLNDYTLANWFNENPEEDCFLDPKPSDKKTDSSTPNPEVLPLVQELSLAPATTEDELPHPLAGLEDMTLIEWFNLTPEERGDVVDNMWDINSEAETLANA